MTDPTIRAAWNCSRRISRSSREAVDGAPFEALDWRPPAKDSNPLTVLATHGMHSTCWWLTISARGASLRTATDPRSSSRRWGASTKPPRVRRRDGEDCLASLDPEEPF